MKRKRATKAAPARPAPTPRGVGGTKPHPAPATKTKSSPATWAASPLEYCKGLIRDVPDFPKPGILFRDITPLLADARGFTWAMDALSTRFVGAGIDAVVGIESRGFIFGAVLAQRINAGFVPVRKPGKLPAAKHTVEYELEYGNASLDIHRDGLSAGARTLIVDDLLATGGTAAATAELVRRVGARVEAFVFVVELLGLGGRAALQATPTYSFITYD